jgi:hypothetical protein
LKSLKKNIKHRFNCDLFSFFKTEVKRSFFVKSKTKRNALQIIILILTNYS